MKLNPPASSSDLELARQIARRLHQNRRRGDRVGAEEAQRLVPPSGRQRSGSPEPALPRRSAAQPVPAHAPAAESLRAPELGVEPETEREVEVVVSAGALEERLEAAPELEVPSFEEPAAWQEPAQPSSMPLDDLDPEEPPAFRPAEPRYPEPESELAGPDVEVDVDVDEPPLEEQLVGVAPDAEPDPSPLDQLAGSEDSPFDDTLLDAPPVAQEGSPPSWDDVVDNCQEIAQARAAMLVDPAGQVFAARGDWPAPGPDAIAAKLVAMMAKTLKDAPTRSISAPLMGLHLTAWRVPLPEGLVTAAFIGPAAVRADTRPAIDQAITAAAQG